MGTETTIRPGIGFPDVTLSRNDAQTTARGLRLMVDHYRKLDMPTWAADYERVAGEIERQLYGEVAK